MEPSASEPLDYSFLDALSEGDTPDYEQLYLSYSPTASTAPSLTNEEWENLHRDCASFPAYTDYLYDPDPRPASRPQASSHAFLSEAQMQAEAIVAEMQAASVVARLSTIQTRTPAMMEEASKKNDSTHMPSHTSYAGSSQNIPVVGLGQPPQNYEYQHTLLVPGEIRSTKYQGLPDIQRRQIDDDVIISWSIIQSPHHDGDTKSRSHSHLEHVTRMCLEHHCRWLMCNAIRHLWYYIQVSKQTPDDHPQHQHAMQQINGFLSQLTPESLQNVDLTITAMTKAESEGRDPFDEVAMQDQFLPITSNHPPAVEPSELAPFSPNPSVNGPMPQYSRT